MAFIEAPSTPRREVLRRTEAGDITRIPVWSVLRSHQNPTSLREGQSDAILVMLIGIRSSHRRLYSTILCSAHEFMTENLSVNVNGYSLPVLTFFNMIDVIILMGVSQDSY